MKYYMHDNGGIPFMVETNKNTVKVYKRLPSDESRYSFESTPKLTFKAKKIFIGNSPINSMTKFSGGYGKRFNGNSILLHIDSNNYVFIGENVFSFKSLAPIGKYVSPVGNNDVPYPYAIDDQNNYYLIISNIILKNPTIPKKYDDPYQYYFDHHLITTDLGRVPPRKPIIQNDLNIIKYYIGNQQYTLTHNSNPVADYKRLIPSYGKAMYIVTSDSPKKKLLTKEGYIKLIKNFGKKLNVIPFKNKKILIKRQI